MASAGIGRIKLGSQGLEVSAQGLGCMGMSALYGPPKPEQDMISLIHHAIHTGVTFLDTSDMYGPFLNEILLGKVLINSLSLSLSLSLTFLYCYHCFLTGFEGRAKREGRIGNKVRCYSCGWEERDPW